MSKNRNGGEWEREEVREGEEQNKRRGLRLTWCVPPLKLYLATTVVLGVQAPCFK